MSEDRFPKILYNRLIFLAAKPSDNNWDSHIIILLEEMGFNEMWVDEIVSKDKITEIINEYNQSLQIKDFNLCPPLNLVYYITK